MQDPTHSTEATLVIDDVVELQALNRALQVALRCEAADDPAVLGSPIVAKLAHRVVDVLVKRDEAKQGRRAVEKWERWRRAESRPTLLAYAERRVAATENWSDLSVEVRRQMVESWIAPFVAPVAWIEHLLGEPSAKGATGALAHRTDPPRS